MLSRDPQAPGAAPAADDPFAALRRNWRTVASTDNLQLLGNEAADATSAERTAPVSRRRLLLQGACFSAAGAALLGLAAAITVAKLLPPRAAPSLDALRRDEYYCYLVPLMLPVTFVAVTANWFSLKLFKHNS